MLKTNLPVLIVNDIVLLPYNEIKFEIEDNNLKKIATLSENYFNNHVLVVCCEKKDFKLVDLPKIGVIGQIKMKLDMPNGKVKLTLKGICRSSILGYNIDNGIYDANVVNIEGNKASSIESLADARLLKKLFIEYLDNKKSLGNSLVSRIDDVNDLEELTDLIAGFIPIVYKRKIQYVETPEAKKRVMMLMDDLHYELSLLEYENSLDSEIEHKLEDDEKKYILNEKLKLIQQELGINENDDYLNLQNRIAKLDCPIHVKNKLADELNRYKLCNSNSPEIGILRNYIDTLLSLPWNISTRENMDLENIRKVLDENHYGLDEVKERILEFIATKKYTKTKSNPIICLVGPPGTGKTSLAKTISVALKRKCIKISVGGINDEAEITGHRRAYIGALPGKIMTGIMKVGVNNPVFIIDEIDKMTKDIKGDPASSLLEVLDKEQNDKFVDHFVEEEFDLSKVMFILTANYLDKIPTELRDRLEIIELSSYTLMDKVEIVKKCLIKKLRLEYHLTKDEIMLSDEVILDIINHYTKESGVRELERVLRKICRKYLCDKMEKKEVIAMSNLEYYLGKAKYYHVDNYQNEQGMMNILSYHPLGGELLKVESSSYPGDGKIELTGSLGDVLKESIELSFAYLKTHAKEFDLSFETFLKKDFFIHITNGGIKKDGPSAGICIVSSLLSLLKQKIISNRIAMSGEISLSGKVLKVGGIKEKLILAMNNNVDTLYLPFDNKNDVLELKDLSSKHLKIIYVNNYLEIYRDLFKK